MSIKGLNLYITAIICFLVFNIPIMAQDVIRFEFKPYVIRYDQSDLVLFKAWITGYHTKVSFEYNGMDRPMYDDSTEGEDYRVVYKPGQPVFNDLELYLMGLFPADSVKPHFVFDNQDQHPKAGGLLLGPVTNVSIQDIISVVGQRDPDFNSSQKEFRIGTIVVSEKLLTFDEMSFFDFFAGRAELKETGPFHSGFSLGTAIPFNLSTRGEGSLLAGIGDARADISLAYDFILWK